MDHDDWRLVFFCLAVVLYSCGHWIGASVFVALLVMAALQSHIDG